MKEQHGVPLFPQDVIRFDHSRTATTAQPGGPSTSNRSRTPPTSIPRAGHSIHHHPEDTPFLTDAVPPRAARSSEFAEADYGSEQRSTRSRTSAVRYDQPEQTTRRLDPKRTRVIKAR